MRNAFFTYTHLLDSCDPKTLFLAQSHLRAKNICVSVCVFEGVCPTSECFNHVEMFSNETRKKRYTYLIRYNYKTDISPQ